MSFGVSETWPRRRSDLMITDWRDISDWMRVKESVVETRPDYCFKLISIRLFLCVLSFHWNIPMIILHEANVKVFSLHVLHLVFTSLALFPVFSCDAEEEEELPISQTDRKIKIHYINWCRVFKNKISPIFHDLFHNLSMVVRERRHLLIEET